MLKATENIPQMPWKCCLVVLISCLNFNSTLCSILLGWHVRLVWRRLGEGAGMEYAVWPMGDHLWVVCVLWSPRGHILNRCLLGLHTLFFFFMPPAFPSLISDWIQHSQYFTYSSSLLCSAVCFAFYSSIWGSCHFIICCHPPQTSGWLIVLDWPWWRRRWSSAWHTQSWIPLSPDVYYKQIYIMLEFVIISE